MKEEITLWCMGGGVRGKSGRMESRMGRRGGADGEVLGVVHLYSGIRYSVGVWGRGGTSILLGSQRE